jgi:N,N-dimethylformamidase
MSLIGYLSSLSCRAGETVDLMISSSEPSVSVDFVRLIHGDESPQGPGFLYVEISEVSPLSVVAGEMGTPIGSYGRCDERIAVSSKLEGRISIWPTMPLKEGHQAIVSFPDLGLCLTLERGIPALKLNDQVLLSGKLPLADRTWYSIGFTVEAEKSELSITELHDGGEPTREFEKVHGSGAVVSGRSSILFAAARLQGKGEQTFAQDVFNGKLAAPAVWTEGQKVSWDFSQDMDSQAVPATTAGGPKLHLVNVPTRAMTGPEWDGSVYAWTQNPRHYDAIHFHDDDLCDAKWPVAARIQIPQGLKSGVYAVRLQARNLPADYIPLAVRPGSAGTDAKIVLVLGTYTYAAYANERLTATDFEQPSEIPVQTGPWEALSEAHPEWGKSSYDLHSDGSGVAYSSVLRPIVNYRPTYRFWGFDAPRSFSSDLYIVYFLHRLGVPFDVITEHDLALEPETILAPYQTVIVSTHPEYYSGPMLDAYDVHVARGGGLLYLGGNGFYWVTTPVPGLPHVTEVRKSEGLRHWDAEPGERYHASTGELGGLWRSRGRSAHKTFGVGMAGHGWDRKAPGYRRSPASYRQDIAWVFEGIDDQVIGDFGLIMNGTAGDEIDRIDYRYGTPPDTIVLASSEPHSEWYVPIPEDVTTVSNFVNAKHNKNVRSDIVLIENQSGGAVFSVGSMTFAAALPINECNNNVARLLQNVVLNFTSRSQR